MAKPPPPAGRYGRVVEKSDHMPPALDQAGIDKNLTHHIYGTRQWTMECIGEALNFGIGTLGKVARARTHQSSLIATRQTPDTSRAAQSDLLQMVAVEQPTDAPTAQGYGSLEALHNGQS